MTARRLGLRFVLVAAAFAVASQALGADPKAKGYRADYIDAMLKAAWDEAKLKPSPDAGDAAFLRRVYLDVLGRIPSVQEAEAFLRQKDRDKRLKQVEYLLESPDYAKNMATIWSVTLIGRQNQGNDVNRAALSTWLRQQFGADRPWNEMAYELIGAKGSNRDNGATNYTLAHLENGAVPLTSITMRVFMGQQIQCTQCHDHPKIDEWKQADFWGINAFFKGVRRREHFKADATGAEVRDYIELYDEPSTAYSRYDRRDGQVKIVYPTFAGHKIGTTTEANRDRREMLARLITAPGNDQFARAFVDRMWGHFFGKGIVDPVDDFGPENQASLPELLDRLTADFKASGYDVKALVRWITSSRAYQLDSRMTKANEKDDALFSHMALKPMTPEQLFDSLLVATSAQKVGAGGADNERKRNEWLRQFVFAFANDEGDESSTFQGTIPQALMMMNGDLMNRAVGGKPGSFLADSLEQSQLQNRVPPARFLADRLYLAALCRPASRRELAEAQLFLVNSPDQIQVMEDLFWALLNSNEFILNH
ncbi:MAG TPA: DUF1549 and DUF1553 domain-containing protein [Isosphaeraceae bacterium]|jgi:hypothetical protein|nr:DUF1549 and DUF1553 domain-containing protein [Isosphaeraceae bacterium]